MALETRDLFRSKDYSKRLADRRNMEKDGHGLTSSLGI